MQAIQKKQDHMILAAFPILALVVSMVFRTNILVTTLLFLGLPSLWLTFRLKKIFKPLIFSIIISIPLSIIFDYIGAINFQWFVPRSMFEFRIFNAIAIEMLIWGFLFVYSIVLYFDYFHPQKEVKNLGKLSQFIGLLLAVFLIIKIFFPHLLYIKYAYFWIGIIFMIIPMGIFYWKNPKITRQAGATTVYFSYLYIVFELVAIKLHLWLFPGEYLGWITITGLAFPLEEFVFWILLSPMCIIAYYRFFE